MTTQPTSQSGTSEQGETTQANPFEMSPTAAQPGQEAQQTESTQQSQETTQPSQQQSATPQQPAQPAQPAFDPQTITKSIVDGIVAAHQKTAQAQPAQPVQQQQQPAMSPEEFRRHFGIPEVNAQTYKAMLGVDPQSPEQVQALDNLMQGFMRAGLNMGQSLVQQQLQQLQARYDQQLQPLLSAHQAAQEAAIANEFTTSNPDLKDEMATVNEVRDAMIARGVTFSSKEEMFKQVGTATRQLLGRIRGQAAAGGQTQPGSNAAPAGSPKPAARTMTPSMQGGRGGSGGSGKSTTTTAEAVFGS